jgi:hypothetical protein
MNAPLRSGTARAPESERVRPTGRPHLEVASTLRAQPEPRIDRARRRRPSAAQLSLALVFGLVAWGLGFPTEQYITPRTGVGYALGIAGGSAMLLLLVYPLRKRVRLLAFLGTTKRWFQAHMALGIVGPLLILFHSNFSLGATNSNVALACMLVVSGSGLFGRYFYARIHHGLHGRRTNLAELKLYAEKLRWVTANVDFLPGLVDRIDAEEQALVDRCSRAWLLARPLLGASKTASARRRLRRFVRESLHEAVGSGGGAAERSRRLHATAVRYIDDRLGAIRRVVEFDAFERLFSLWHALHLPLFLMLLVAGVVHVVAVHLY